MSNYKFYLEFLNDGTGKVLIEEPIDFASLIWVLKQKPMHGRDIMFNDGESEMKFVWTRNHYLDKIFFYDQMFGFESKVRFYVEIDGLQTILGDLDFATRKTDGLEYFSCKVIQDSKLLTVNRQSKVKVDVLSNKDLSGEAITPLIPTNILVKAKSVFQESKWDQPQEYSNRLETKNTRYYSINPCVNILNSEIADTLTFYSVESNDIREFLLITAKDRLTNLNLSLKGCSGVLNPDSINGGNGYLNFALNVRSGLLPTGFVDTMEKKTLIVKSLSDTDPEFNFNQDFNINIPFLNRGESICISYDFYLRQSASTPIGKMICDAILNIKEINITAESTGYSSITKAFRLHDVMKQVVKSSSGLGIKASRFDYGGEFYDNFLFDGKLLRSIIDKPFLISLEQLGKSIVEMNADYEVNDDVFFSIEKDFYNVTEIWFFDKVQFSGMNITYNPEITINKFNFKYKNYQSLKENEQPNSDDTIHGEIELLLQNKMVENNKVVDVDWIRDSFLIDEARKKSIEISTGTSYQNDTDIFCLDCISNQVDLIFTEVSQLNHEWNPSLNKLFLRSDSTLNFSIIGLFEGANLTINAPDKNTGVYTIFKVSNQELQLTWISGGVMASTNDGVRFTEYTYTIPKEQIPYMSRTNEGMVTENIKSPETFANLGYSVKRNVQDYYNDYLATCNIYQKEKAITATQYKHNGECIIEYEGKKIKENEAFTPINPILNPLMYNDMVFSNFYFDEYLLFINELRNRRGYFRTIGNDGNPIKGYVKDLKYDPLKKELTITAKGKYDPVLMTITNENKIITINNETKLYLIDTEVKDDKLYIYDSNRQLLYRPVFYNMVSINNATTNSINIFKEWLELLK